ncbi:MAG: VCBS repeat-containing protein [Planctomycetes bacterium]|nr:VCBS repeat-containing protein [Planctomycetota bacterium]
MVYLTGTVVNGAVWAYDHTGAVIYHAIANDPSPAIGWGPTLAKFMDWNDDGCDDFLVGLYDFFGGGGCELVSGRTGLPLFRINDPTPGGNYNQGLERCGDLDGDGLPDILLGNGAGFSMTGAMQARSSGTGQILHAWSTPWPSDSFGRFMNGDVDMDQDGIADILVGHSGEPLGGACPSCYGSVKVFSGRDGQQMFRFFDYPLSNSGSFATILSMPPRRGNVFPRFVAVNTGGRYPIGYPNSYFTFGRIYMFEGGPEGSEVVGEGCVGTLPREPRIGLRALSPSSSRITVADAPAGALALLVLGGSLVPTPNRVSLFGDPDCLLAPAPIEAGLLLCGASGIDAGYAYHDFARPFAGRELQSVDVFGQWMVLDPNGAGRVGLSKALHWRF